MRRLAVIVLSITAAFAVDKKPAFSVQPAASYPGHATQEKITIGVKPYNTNELAATAFGKVKPHERGILPVLVVIQNDTGKPLRLDLKAEFVTAEMDHLEAMPADDVVRFQGVQKRPGMRPDSLYMANARCPSLPLCSARGKWLGASPSGRPGGRAGCRVICSKITWRFPSVNPTAT